MNKIRWYGPTLMLIITMLVVMVAGPGIIRQLEWNRTDASIQLARERNIQNPSLAEMSAAFRNVARMVKPNVVHIQVLRQSRPGLSAREEEMLKRLLPREKREAPNENGAEPDFREYDAPQAYGNGSGWVYDDKGHIVTNYHVVEGADKIIVRFGDGSERIATLVGEPDEKTDIAVIKVPEGNLHPAKLANERVQQGDIVFAFGSPFRFEFSMSQGIVSGMGRELGILRGRAGYENFIQTDASINPGNSGGPLTNIYGEVVGMNTAIATRSGGNQGLGFAIPVDMVEYVVEWILSEGKVRRGYLGVYIDDLDPKMAKTFNFTGTGVLVMSPIDGSPGSKAGIKMGDIITKVDGTPVTTAQYLRRVIARHAPGSKVKIDLFRKGQMIQLTLVVGEAPQRFASATPPKPDTSTAEQPKPRKPRVDKANLLKKLGFDSVETLTKELAKRSRIDFTPGVIVRTVRPNSIAHKEGIGRGHVITHVMDTPVTKTEELVEALATSNLAEGVRITTMVNGLTRFTLLELPE